MLPALSMTGMLRHSRASIVTCFRGLSSSPTGQSRNRVHNDVPEEVDVAVIGCGSAGLMAAASLAFEGKKVAVFDGHYVVGGCASQFSRKRKYRFDVGLHYVGDVPQFNTLLSDVGINDVDFVPMDQDGFDTLVFPGLEFRVPANREGEPFGEPFRKRLLETFPSEEKAINSYVNLLGDINNIIVLSEKRRRGQLSFMDATKLGSLGNLMKYKNSTMGKVLDDITDNMQLRGVLMGQNGDYGMPPSEVSALLHCGLVGHYLKGGFYPKGGGQAMSDRLADVIENNGGSIHLRRRIDRILVDDSNKVMGVETAPRRGVSQTVRAKAVVAAGDLQATVNNLIDPSHLPSKYIKKINDYEHACGLQMTFLVVDKTKDQLRDFGMGVTGATNYWCFDEFDFDHIYKRLREEEGIPNVGAYITCASQKDPESLHAPEGESTIEVLTMCSGDPAKWGVSYEDMQAGNYRHNPVYKERKMRLEDGMVERLEARFPGLAQHIIYKESATPMSHHRFTHGGTCYGLAASPDQFLDKRPGGRSKHIAGLYFTGHNIRPGHGVVSAMSGGRGCGLSVLKDMKAQGENFPTLKE